MKPQTLNLWEVCWESSTELIIFSWLVWVGLIDRFHTITHTNPLCQAWKLPIRNLSGATFPSVLAVIFSWQPCWGSSALCVAGRALTCRVFCIWDVFVFSSLQSQKRQSSLRRWNQFPTRHQPVSLLHPSPNSQQASQQTRRQIPDTRESKIMRKKGRSFSPNHHHRYLEGYTQDSSELITTVLCIFKNFSSFSLGEPTVCVLFLAIIYLFSSLPSFFLWTDLPVHPIWMATVLKNVF